MSKDDNRSLIHHRLLASEQRLRSLLEGMLDGFITIDAFGVIQNASESCETLFGYPSAELVGRNIKILMPEPHQSQHDDYLARYRETGDTWILGTTREFEVVKRSGDKIVCELSVARVDVPGQHDPLFTGTFRDVTARTLAERALRESERKLRAIFDQEFQYVGMLAPDGTLLEINQAALMVVGATRQDVIGKPFWETPWWDWSEEGKEELEASVRRAAGGEFVRYQTQNSSRDGSLRTIDFSLKPVIGDDGGVELLVAEGRDITDLELARQRETSMLRALAAIGESASILAHEIKNPITAVNGALRAVSRQLDADDRVIIEGLVESMQRLERLIRRTLSFARPLEPSPVRLELPAVMKRVRDGVADELARTETTLEIDVEDDCPSLLADADLLDTALTNLVRNGIEAVEACGKVRVSAGDSGDGFVLVSIEDNGPGISEEVRSTIFQPYVTKKDNGTGIGLALVKRIVEEHGGTIVAGDSDLGGAAFWLRLPHGPKA